MADNFAAPDMEAAPAAPPPAPAISPEIEALIAQRVQELSDKRVAGLQSTYDKKLTELGKELARVRTQALGEPDPEPQESEASKRIADLERQNALLRASQTYPDGVAEYQRMMSFESAEEQIAYLQELKRSATPPPPPPPPSAAPDMVPADVDPNRPAPSSPGGFSNYDGITMTDELAKQIIGSVQTWPDYSRR